MTDRCGDREQTGTAPNPPGGPAVYPDSRAGTGQDRHRHDRMTTRSRQRVCRGESDAEQYAVEYAERNWERFLDEFGMP